MQQRIHALLRDKYEAEAHSTEAHAHLAAPGADVKGLFRKFTPGMPFLGPQSNGAGHVVDENAPKQGFGDRFAGLGDRFSKSFSRPQQ